MVQSQAGRRNAEPWVVPVTPSMREQATAWERQIMASPTVRERANHTGVQVSGRYRVGYLGELAMAQLLTRYGRRFVHRVQTDGKSAGAEFTVYRQGRAVKLDVKVRHEALVVYQAERADAQVYVGCVLEEYRRVRFKGWLPADQLRVRPATPVPVPGSTRLVPARTVPWDALRPMESLMAVLDAAP